MYESVNCVEAILRVTGTMHDYEPLTEMEEDVLVRIFDSAEVRESLQYIQNTNRNGNA